MGKTAGIHALPPAFPDAPLASPWTGVLMSGSLASLTFHSPFVLWLFRHRLPGRIGPPPPFFSVVSAIAILVLSYAIAACAAAACVPIPPPALCHPCPPAHLLIALSPAEHCRQLPVCCSLYQV